MQHKDKINLQPIPSGIYKFKSGLTIYHSDTPTKIRGIVTEAWALVI